MEVGIKHQFPHALRGPAPGSSQGSVGRARALGGGSGDSRLLLTLKCLNTQLFEAEQASMSSYCEPCRPEAPPCQQFALPSPPATGCVGPGDGQEPQALSGTE